MGETAAIEGTDRSSSGYARYVGRVGGLAFALGVGAAILTGPAVASAETTDAGNETSTAQQSDPGPAESQSDPAVTEADADAEDADADANEDANEDADELADDETELDAEDESEEIDGEPEDTEEPQETDDQSTSSNRNARIAPPPEAVQTEAVEAAAEEPTAFERFFENQTPTLDHIASENEVVNGKIEGALNPSDADSSKLTYSASKPSHGTVVINSADGTFVYTPNSTYAGQDKFVVTVSDARSGFHIHGFAGLLNLVSFGLLGSSGHRSTQTVFIGFDRTVVASGLEEPVDFRFLPDGRVVVAEQGGKIKLIQNGAVLAQPMITLPVGAGGERGISGIAVDPDFATPGNSYLYVSYVSTSARNRLSRLTVVGNTAGSELVLLESSQSEGFIHHGGALGFGTDKALYWGVGDNGNGQNAQTLTNLHGKILRINRDGSIPAGNPSLGAGTRPEIYAYGLRNPFRLNFTPDGKLLVADVGNAAFEEVNLVTAGGNYGWPSSEGLCTSSCGGKKDPIYTYARGSGAAITSIMVYNGSTFGPGYVNKVFIADTVQGWIKVLTCNAGFTSCQLDQTFDSAAGATVVLTQGPDGNTYQLKYDPGTVVRISPAGEPL